MRYDSSYEQGSLETYDELSDAFETGLEETGSDFETDTEALDGELTDSEEGEEEYEEEGEEEFPARAVRRGGGGNVQMKLNQQRAALAKLRGSVQSVGRHIRKDGARLRFTLPARTVTEAAGKLRLDPRTVSALLKSLKTTNQRLQSGRRGELDMEADETMMWQEVSGACPGTTKVSTHWWGVSIWLNECHTKTLVEAAGAGASAAALCAAVAPHPVAKGVCAVAAPIIGIGAGAIKAIDALGGNKGIIIRKPWISPLGVPPIVIWHQ
jgi:hypothetical protein